MNTKRFIENDIMTFLSETDIQNANTVSFGSGKPDATYFDMENSLKYIQTYFDYLKEKGLQPIERSEAVGQYTQVKGIIPEFIKKYWETDLGFQNIDKEDILLTVGAQEAYVLAILRLCEQDKHTILTEDPSYIGFSSFARLNGYTIDSIAITPEGGMNLEILEAKLKTCQENGKPVQLIYVNPDFHNPTGKTMPIEKRTKLIALAETWGFYLLEDNAYKIFQYEGEVLPTLKELDKYDRVLYVESFSKSVFPSIRIAALYATGTIQFNGKEVQKIDLLAETKAYISVNNPTLDQAFLGGVLLENNYSITTYAANKVKAMKEKRDCLITTLEKHIAEITAPIHFQIPNGGFFLELQVPFTITKAQLECAIKKYQVIFCPIWFFYMEGSSSTKTSIRLAFSKISLEEIRQGVQNLFQFLKNEML